MSNSKGFSLVELIVVMAIFIIIMMVATSAFENIISRGGQQTRSAETQIEGLVGLELLRSDLEHLGYALPWTIPIPPAGGKYAEVTENPVTGITSSNFNEAAPRAVLVAQSPAGAQIIDGSSNTNPGISYLVVKSLRIALSTATKNEAPKKWAYVTYSFDPGSNANTSTVSKWGTTDDFKAGERVITLNTTFSTDGIPGKQLAMDPVTSQYFYSVSGTPPVQPVSDAFKPGDASMNFVVYGVDSNTDLRMPFNRADYYLKKPGANMPSSCNPGTGILYKGLVRHADGKFEEYPLLNCVGDLQVEFELDRNNDGTDLSQSPTLTAKNGITPLTAADIRSQLKTVRVFILAHEGKKDRSYTYNKDTIQVGDPVRLASSGRTWSSAEMQSTFGADWKNYRWKVYTIVVQPKNLD